MKPTESIDLLLFAGAENEWLVLSEQPGDTVIVDEVKTGTFREKLQHAYQALWEKFDYRERLCAACRNAKQILVIHGDTLSVSDAQLRVMRFFSMQRKKHARWLWIDSILAGLGTLLFFLPGPNIFFLYPAARAFSHYLALKGIQAASQPGILSFQREALVTRIESRLPSLQEVESEISELEQTYRISNLQGVLEKR